MRYNQLLQPTENGGYSATSDQRHSPPFLVCSFTTFAYVLDFFQYGIGCRCPDKGSSRFILMFREVLYLCDEFFHAPERSSLHCFPGDVCKPPLHLVEPCGTGGSEVHCDAGIWGEPFPHFRMLVRSVVVRNSMNIQRCGHVLVDLLEKGEEFLMAMPRLAVG